jgi:hypothetical protein
LPKGTGEECINKVAWCKFTVVGELRKRGVLCEVCGIGAKENDMELWGIVAFCRNCGGVWRLFMTGEENGCVKQRGDNGTNSDARGLMFIFDCWVETGEGVPLIIGRWDCDAEGRGIGPYCTGEKRIGEGDVCTKFCDKWWFE